MAFPVVDGALLECNFGLVPSQIKIWPYRQMWADNKPIGITKDYIAFLNVQPFCLCFSMANLDVIAANGVPQDCLPILVGPWDPGSALSDINGDKMLLDTDTIVCAKGSGKVTVFDPGQRVVKVSG